MPRLWRRPLDADTIVPPRGQVFVVRDRCKGCGLCVEYCPRGALAMSSEFNAKGYHPPEVVEADLCVDCKLCEMLCPEFAIFSIADRLLDEAGRMTSSSGDGRSALVQASSGDGATSGCCSPESRSSAGTGS